MHDWEENKKQRKVATVEVEGGIVKTRG